MGVLEFIFDILVLAVAFIVALGGICMHYDTKKLKEENEKLKNDLKKARERKSKREYKQARDMFLKDLKELSKMLEDMEREDK